MRDAIGVRYDAPRNSQGKKMGAEKPVYMYGGHLDRRNGRDVIHIDPPERYFDFMCVRPPTEEEAAKLEISREQRMVEVEHEFGSQVYVANRVEFVIRFPD
jgi:hypothetical protein